MTIGQYCEQVGLQLIADDSSCSITNIEVEQGQGFVPAQADTLEALVTLTAGRTLRSIIRPTTRYWVTAQLTV